MNKCLSCECLYEAFLLRGDGCDGHCPTCRARLLAERAEIMQRNLDAEIAVRAAKDAALEKAIADEEIRQAQQVAAVEARKAVAARQAALQANVRQPMGAAPIRQSVWGDNLSTLAPRLRDVLRTEAVEDAWDAAEEARFHADELARYPESTRAAIMNDPIPDDYSGEGRRRLFAKTSVLPSTTYDTPKSRSLVAPNGRSEIPDLEID